MKTNIIDPATYPVSPDQINTDRHFFEAFDDYEMEVSARWIVRFCQQRGQGWQPFTAADINDFYRAEGQHGEFGFNGLDLERFIVLKGGRYYFTDEFVSRCFRASPVV